MEPTFDPLAQTESPPDLPITTAQRAELQDRLTDYRAHPETSIPWEVARERMRQGR